MSARRKLLSPAQIAELEKTPPQYRHHRYRESGALYKPAKPDEMNVRVLMRRVGDRLESVELSMAGRNAFSAWLTKLIREDNIWLAKASYAQFGQLLKARLYEVFQDEFPGSERDMLKIEAALFAEFRQLPDFEEPRKAMPKRRPPQRPVLVKDPFKVVS